MRCPDAHHLDARAVETVAVTKIITGLPTILLREVMVLNLVARYTRDEITLEFWNVGRCEQLPRYRTRIGPNDSAG